MELTRVANDDRSLALIEKALTSRNPAVTLMFTDPELKMWESRLSGLRKVQSIRSYIVPVPLTREAAKQLNWREKL